MPLSFLVDTAKSIDADNKVALAKNYVAAVLTLLTKRIGEAKVRDKFVQSRMDLGQLMPPNQIDGFLQEKVPI